MQMVGGQLETHVICMKKSLSSYLGTLGQDNEAASTVTILLLFC
jgi:hypothetical protein